MLFLKHGPPLVLKSDNGSPFIAAALRPFLERWQVWHLRSPPRTPRYNGSCEAGIGSMKTRTHHQAARRGCAGEWNCDDLEAARLQANQTARPWGLHGPTPETAWQERRPIKPSERRDFAKTVRRLERRARQEYGYPPQGQLCSSLQAMINRAALARALIEHRLLEYRAKRVPEQP
jgi:transposase InsO family protein